MDALQYVNVLGRISALSSIKLSTMSVFNTGNLYLPQMNPKYLLAFGVTYLGHEQIKLIQDKHENW